jgi:hypothetical protein
MVKNSFQEQVKALLERTIGAQLDRVATGFAKRFPEGKNKYLLCDQHLFGVRFYVFLRFGFDKKREEKSAEQGIGLQPAAILARNGEPKHNTKGQV